MMLGWAWFPIPVQTLHPVSDDAPILLDVTRLIWRRWRGRLPTGVDRVCLAYLRHFGPSAQAVIQHERFRGILDRKASEELFALLDSPGWKFKVGLISGALRNYGRVTNQGRGRAYLNIGHTGLDGSGFTGWLQDANVKPIYLVHDLIPITHPQFCRRGEDDKHRKRMRTVLRTASGVIGNSQATLDELAGFARSEGLPNPPGVAAWLGIDPFPEPSPSPKPKPTFVTVGTIEARKNHLLLLEIWSRLIERFGDNAPRLLIIGQRGWEAEPVFARLDRDESLRGHVVELNHCSDMELAAHIAAARALLFPSFVEGYGLPLTEALAAGVPVIASDLPVFREIGAEIPEFLDPHNDAAWEAAILDYAETGSDAREEQLQRIKSFRVPTWHDHFQSVEGWLDSLGLAS